MPLVTDETGRIVTPADPNSPAATPTPVPTPTTPPRVLTICMADEPETLYLYGDGSPAKALALEAIYDGPIDRVGYEFQPVILEKLPSLSDGDATLEPVAVQAGDWVVNDGGQFVQLGPGELIRPFGCASPECAVAWDGSPLEMTQLSATFILKEGIEWSDGTLLTAADSVFSFELARSCQEESGCGGLGLVTGDARTVERTASYTAMDDRSVRWVGSPGFRDPNYMVNFFIPLPESQLGSVPAESRATAPPLGWGPYVLESWVPGDHIRLQANPRYFRAGEGLPAFDQLIMRFLDEEDQEDLDPERLQNALLTGTCDLLDQSASQSLLTAGLDRLEELDERGSIGAHIAAGPTWEQADFGLLPISSDDSSLQPTGSPFTPTLFSDPRTRQGIAQCMDRQRVVTDVFGGLTSIPQSYMPGDHPLINPDLPRYDYDPAAGAELLTQAGWIDSDGDAATPRISLRVSGVPDGTPLQFSYMVSEAPQRLEAAEILVDSLRECGIQAEVVSGPAGEIYAPGPDGPVFGRKFQMAQFAWESGVLPPCGLWTSEQIPGDPNLTSEEGVTLYPYGWGGVNASGYTNPEFDRACRAALEALPGEADYQENHFQVQAIFAAELPAIPLYFHPRVVVTRADLCGFEFDPSASSEFWNIEGFDYGDSCQE